jgi:hypothetical protein
VALEAWVDCTGGSVLKTETVRPQDLEKGDRVLCYDAPTIIEDVEPNRGYTRIKLMGNWLQYGIGADHWFERVIEEEYEPADVGPLDSDYDDGVKYDSDKPRFSLVPSASLRAIAQVLTYGAKKYPQADNWKRADNARERYTDALLRHVYAWMDGEALDPESGLHHLAHAGCCVLFLLHFEEEK